MKMNQKGFANTILVAVGVVILVGVASYFMFFQKNTSTTNQTPPISNNNPPVTPTPTPTNKIVPPNKILKVSIGLISKQFSPDFYPKVSADG